MGLRRFWAHQSAMREHCSGTKVASNSLNTILNNRVPLPIRQVSSVAIVIHGHSRFCLLCSCGWLSGQFVFFFFPQACLIARLYWSFLASLVRQGVLVFCLPCSPQRM